MDSHMVAAGNNMLPTKPHSPVASPPSASSSPSHEFSFTISLHHSFSSSTSLFPDHTRSSNNNKAKTSPLAIDLSPADDIFFHGHLLPLQFLSHLPVSPRSSTNSLDSFTLPIRDFVVDDHQEPTFQSSNSCSTSVENNNIIKNKSNSNSNIQEGNSHNGAETSGRTKAKSFSIFGLQKRRKEQDEDNKQGMKQKRFDVSNILKRYARMVKLFTGRKQNHVHFSRRQQQLQQQPHSFSGDLSPRIRQIKQLRGMRAGEFSAPASMRTSPTNSGLLRATSGASTPSNTNDSTMEELQAAIQAAIAHCKNSSATEEKIKCLDQ